MKVGDELSDFTSAYFPRGHKVSAAALSRLSQDDRRTHIIEADTNCHHEDWDRYDLRLTLLDINGTIVATSTR